MNAKLLLLLPLAAPLFAAETIVPDGVDARLVRVFSEADASYSVDADGNFLLVRPVDREHAQPVTVSGATQVGAGGVETRRVEAVAYQAARRPDPDALALVLADRSSKKDRNWEVGKSPDGVHYVRYVCNVAGGASTGYLMDAIDEAALRAYRGALRLSPGGEPAR